MLPNDNFASIALGVEEGRRLYDNLRKTIAYSLTHLWPELYPVVLNCILGLPMGLTPIQILSIDACSEIPPAVSFVFEASERDIMKIPPRPVMSTLVSRNLLIYSYVFASTFVTLGCIFAYFCVFWYVFHHQLLSNFSSYVGIMVYRRSIFYIAPTTVGTIGLRTLRVMAWFSVSTSKCLLWVKRLPHGTLH